MSENNISVRVCVSWVHQVSGTLQVCLGYNRCTRFFTLQSSFHNLDWRKRCVSMKLSTSSKAEDSKVVWTPNLVRQVKRAFRIVRRDEDGRNCVRRGKRPHLLLTLCSTIDLCTPNTSNCRRTGWRGQQTPIAPTLSAHNLLNFPAPSQLKLWDRCS
ncbi:uncharacterized protein [Procambarus clarkii]|uniref:uncharacterized protein isoform X2 n=1 Tax=Procambarus clarkii TaxID=6728 RepID=UPI00374237CD